MGGEVGSRGGVGLGGQGGCERRMEVFVKIKKNIYGEVGSRGSGGSCGVGVRIDVNIEVKFL